MSHFTRHLSAPKDGPNSFTSTARFKPDVRRVKCDLPNTSFVCAEGRPGRFTDTARSKRDVGNETCDVPQHGRQVSKRTAPNGPQRLQLVLGVFDQVVDDRS